MTNSTSDSRLKTWLVRIGKLEGLPIAMVLVVLYIVFYASAPRVFSGYRIYLSFMQTVPPMLICALGLTFVITAGEIDLSFPAVVAFAGFVFAWCVLHIGGPFGPWIGFGLALVAGGFIGYVNGVLVAQIGVPSIMATLAAQFFWYGVTVLVAGGLSLDVRIARSNIIHDIFVGRLFKVPVQSLWALGLAVFLWFILNRHKFGEAIMFIGDNPDVARVMGINLETVRMQLFVVNGIIAAFAGLLLTMEINVFFPTQGGSFLLQSLAAVFIGGTSIAGGIGTIVGTFFGAYIIGSLEAGVVASGISGYWTQLVTGSVMAASVVLNIVINEGRYTQFSRRMRERGIRLGMESNGRLSKRASDDTPST